jgi:hypothetical protein
MASILLKVFMLIFLIENMKNTNCARIVGKISGKNIKRIKPSLQTRHQRSGEPQCVITNKNNLIYCEKDRELFLQDNQFIKNKKLISISPGGLKGFYELGVLSYIKDNYDMDNYIFSGASAGAWNALFMCYKNDTKQFVYNLLDYKITQINNIKELKYFLKYKMLATYNNDDFDLRRLFIGVTTVKRFQPVTNIFSDFNSLEDAVKCCIASSHIPLITGGLTNRYYNMYTFDGGFSKYPYLNFTENVLHITPSMWKNLNTSIGINNKNPLLDLDSFTSLNVILELFLMIKNRNYMELFDNGYLDAKNNKELLDKIFLEIEGTTNTTNTNNTNNNNDNDNCDYSKYPNSQLDLTRDNDSY